VRLVAEDPGRGFPQERRVAVEQVVEVVLARAVGREHREATGADLRHGVGERHPRHHGHVEQGAGRGAHHLGVVHVHAGGGEDDGVRPRGVGRADHGAGVPRVAHRGEDRDEPRAGGDHGPQARRRDADDGEHALGIRAHRVQDPGGSEVDTDPGGTGGVVDLAVARSRRRREIDVPDQRCGEAHRLPHALRPLDQEQAVPHARRTPGQRADRPHPLAAGVGQVRAGRAFGHAGPCEVRIQRGWAWLRPRAR